MKTMKNLFAILIVAATASLLIAWLPDQAEESPNSDQNTIVMLKFKAQPEMGGKTVSELYRLLENVKKEPHFVSITMHIDPNDDTNIMLYEEWEDVDYYNGAHMNTDHIKAFMGASRNFLTGPPEITFWIVDKVFN